MKFNAQRIQGLGGRQPGTCIIFHLRSPPPTASTRPVPSGLSEGMLKLAAVAGDAYSEEIMNGAESLVRTLVGGGVNVCFANPGTSEMHFVAALDRVEGCAVYSASLKALSPAQPTVMPE